MKNKLAIRRRLSIARDNEYRADSIVKSMSSGNFQRDAHYLITCMENHEILSDRDTTDGVEGEQSNVRTEKKICFKFK